MIIKNTYHQDRSAFEGTIDQISNAIYAISAPQVIRSEMGGILVDVHFLTPRANAEVDVYSWGTEPATKTVIDYRHDDIDYYARVNLPGGTMRDKNVSRSVAARITAVIFIKSLTDDGKMISAKYLDAAADAIVFQYGATHYTPGNGDAGLRALVRIGMWSDLHAFTSRTRELAEKIFRTTWEDRENSAQEILKESSEYDDIGKDIHLMFNDDPFWESMLGITIWVMKKSYYNHQFHKTSREYINWKATDGGVAIKDYTPYHFVVTVVTTNKLAMPAGWKKPQSGDKKSSGKSGNNVKGSGSEKPTEPKSETAV